MAPLIGGADEVPGGVIITGRVDEGVCATGRIIVHGGVRMKRQSAGGWALSVANGEVFNFAFYSNAVLRDTRQPYDRCGAAYLPMPFAALRTSVIPGYGVLLVQKQPETESIETTVVEDGLIAVFRMVADAASLRTSVAEIAVRAGVPRRKISFLNALPAFLPHSASSLRQLPALQS